MHPTTPQHAVAGPVISPAPATPETSSPQQIPPATLAHDVPSPTQERLSTFELSTGVPPRGPLMMNRIPHLIEALDTWDQPVPDVDARAIFPPGLMLIIQVLKGTKKKFSVIRLFDEAGRNVSRAVAMVTPLRYDHKRDAVHISPDGPTVGSLVSEAVYGTGGIVTDSEFEKWEAGEPERAKIRKQEKAESERKRREREQLKRELEKAEFQQILRDKGY